MKPGIICAIVIGALLPLSGCNNAKSPEKVQDDVAKAQAQAAEDNAKAEDKVRQVESQAAKDRSDAVNKVADKSVGALADAAVTEAEGETKVALAKCEALAGDAQKSCKDAANAHLDEVKARAKSAKSE